MKPLLRITNLLGLMVAIGLLLAACAPAPTAVPPTAVPAAVPTVTPVADLGQALDAQLAGLAEQGYFSGSVLVARGGEVLLSKGYGLADREKNLPNTDQTKFRLASLTKQFTAMAILILENQGKVDVHASVCTYIPDCPAQWQPVTLHHLLTHTAGLGDGFNTDILDESKAVPATTSPVEHAVFLFRYDPLKFTPGASFSYSNLGYVLLAYVIEQVSGQTYEAFVRQNIFEPLGMSHSGQLQDLDGLSVSYDHAYDNAATNPPVDVSVWSGAGGLFSTVEDLYRWDRALYTDTLVPQAALDRMFTVYAKQWDYGYGWRIISSNGRRVYSHTGDMPGARTEIDRYVDDDALVIVLSNQGDVSAIDIANILAGKLFGP